MVNGPNGWDQWGKHVLAELERNNRDHENIMKMLEGIKKSVTEQRVRMAGWAGGISIIVAVVVSLIVKAI